MTDTVTLELSGDVRAPAIARRWATPVLAEWGVTRPGDATIVISELCANAVAHVGETFVIGLSREADRVRVQVWDRSATPPKPASPGPDAPGGRGLQIVAALANWGWAPAARGKVVWADLLR